MPPTGVLKQFTTLAPEITSLPPVRGLPCGSKCTRSVLYGGWGTDHGPIREMAFSVPHSCEDFVNSATAAEHPKHLYTGVPDVLAECVQRCATTVYEDLGKERTATLRKWTLRAQELREQVDPDPPSGHCAKILRGKDLRLFQEMLDSSGHADSKLPSCIRDGFELMGPFLFRVFYLRQQPLRHSLRRRSEQMPHRHGKPFGILAKAPSATGCLRKSSGSHKKRKIKDG